MVKIFVDGREIEAKENALLIDVLFQNDINIPHFCYHPALGKDGNCRMCMVEIEGQKRPQIACDTPVKDGLIIRTKGENIDHVKKSILELELINHPVDCPICDQAGECKLQDYYMDVGLYESRLETKKQKAKKHEDLGANVMLDQERCVLCTRCVRFTTDITKTAELGVLQRADHSVITTFPGKKLSNPYAMNVIDLCPVGALTSKDFRFQKRVWFLETDEIICDGCSKGCNLYSEHHRAKYEDDVLYRYRPRYNEKINGYFICDTGRLSYKKENENRLHKHSILGVEKNIYEIIDALKEFLQQDDVSMIISPSLSMEEMYMVKLLAEKYDAKLIVSTCDYEDESFGDDFLKQNDLALNRRGAKLLELQVDETSKDILIQKAQNLIFIGLKNMNEWLQQASEKGCKSAAIDAFTCKKELCEFVVAMASHTEKEGTFITSDDIFQTSKGRIKKDNQAPSLAQICAVTLDMSFINTKNVLQEALESTQATKQVESEAL